jgi:uncharacterized membrane protein HdeD (DUF308 family)
MESRVSNTRYLSLFKGILMSFLAVLILKNPGAALLTYVMYIGIATVIVGLGIILKSLSVRKVLSTWGWGVLEGLFDLFFGYILLTHPAITAEIIPFLIGFWGAFYAFILIADAFAGGGNLLVKLLAGIFLLILANIIMFNPLMVGLSVAFWAGILLLIMGVYNVFLFFAKMH